MTIRIAMWSGPRNISTAMMRSWENRPDTEVVDEPFYAAYLNQTGSVHPYQDKILNAQHSDFDKVAISLSQGPVSAPLQYQKHMTHHISEQADMSWCKHLRHCFLIRHPAKVVDSYCRSMGECNAADIGIERQYHLYQQLCALSSQNIPVVESDELLSAPEPMLKAICQVLNVTYYPQMLSWPEGKRHSDGVWAPHWYHSVEASTGFAPSRTALPELSPEQQQVADHCLPFYLELKKRALSGNEANPGP